MLDDRSQSIGLKSLRTGKHILACVAVLRLIGKLPFAESLLIEVQCKTPTCPGKHLQKRWALEKKRFGYKHLPNTPTQFNSSLYKENLSCEQAPR